MELSVPKGKPPFQLRTFFVLIARILPVAPRFDCVCVGLSTVDVLALLDRRLREDEKLAAERIVVDGGGPAGTAACAAARCGLKTIAPKLISSVSVHR